MAFGHLVEDLHPLSLFGGPPAPRTQRTESRMWMKARVWTPCHEREERVVDRGLHQEAVQHRAVIAVVVKAVGETRVTVGGIEVGSPDDALVQAGDADLVVLVVVKEEQLIERLGHVIDAAGAGRVIEAVAVGLGHFHLQVALDGAAVGAVAVDPHGAEVHHVDVLTAFNDGGQQVVGSVDVVIELGGAALHRAGGGPLFREVDHGIWALVLKRSSNRWYSWAMSMRTKRIGCRRFSQALRCSPMLTIGVSDSTVDIDLATAEVVHDQDVVALIGQVHHRASRRSRHRREREPHHLTKLIQVLHMIKFFTIELFSLFLTSKSS